MLAQLSVSTRLRHCGNLALQPEMAPRKIDCMFNKARDVFQSVSKAIPGLQINATNISSLGTKNSGLVSIMGTTFLCVDSQ